MMSTWTLSVMDRMAVVRHSNGACISFFAHGPYGMATAHASHFSARGSVCYYANGYSLSSEHR